MPNPKNVSELRSFLGIVNYYGKFLPHLSSRLAGCSIRTLDRFGVENAFQEAKRALQADSLLVHFDGSRSLVLTCDASPHGVGVVLSQVMEYGMLLKL